MAKSKKRPTLYCDRIPTIRDVQKKVKALVPSDGFGPEFEELVIERISDLMPLGLSKEWILKFLDLAIEAQRNK